MRRFALIVLLSFLLLTLPFMYKGSIPEVKASELHQGDLVLTGNNVTVIEGQFDINGSIIVEENATLILRNAVINFTQKHWKQFNLTLRNPVNGHPRLQVSYATITSTPSFQFEICLHGNSTAETYRLYVHNKIIAYETSYVNITDSLHIWYLESYGSSTVSISNSEIWYVKPHDASVTSAEDSDITMAMENYGTSTTSVSNCTIGFLGTYSSSMTTVSNCNITNMHPQGDHSSILTISDSNINHFEVATGCSITMSHCTLVSMETYGSSNASLSNCFVNGMYMHSSSVVRVSNQLITNGSIIVEENATLILRNAVLNFAQVRDYQFNMTFSNPTNGNPRLLAENTTLTTAYSLSVRFHGNSSCKADKLEVWPPHAVGYWWWMYDSSVVSISNSRVYMVTAYADSIFEAFNSTMRYMNAYSQVSANISLSYIESLSCSDASAVNVSNSNIWQLEAKASTIATASNSTINELYTYQSSVLRLINSTYTSCSTYNESKVYIYWYLSVHVIDSEGTDIPSANVTARYPNATVAESKLTNANGWTRLILMEKMINATGNHPVGNYTTTAKYDVHMGQKPVNMTGNKEITISLPFIIPEFPSLLILSLFIIATLLAVIVHRRKHVR